MSGYMLQAKRLEIVVPGNYCSNPKARNNLLPKKVRYAKAKWEGSGIEYADKLIYSTKCAMAEQEWELTDKPIYVGIIVYCPVPPKGHHKRDEKFNGKGISKIRQLFVETARPSIENLYHQHINTLKNIVFKDMKQIVAVFVLRLYDDEPRTEIVFGQPNSIKELLNDIRNL